MKLPINIIRVLVGMLFIFSGLIKANDPLGLAYKMEEYFAVWGWDWANQFSLGLSIAMNVLEIVAGIALLLGWQAALVSKGLLGLMVFFTFLTAYAVFSGKIKTCGCFGDCIPLQAYQSFLKDVVLLALTVILVSNHRYILPIFKVRPTLFIVLLSLGIVFWGQMEALRSLPYVDCLPYAAGKKLLPQMQAPLGSIPDSVVVMYKYKVGNEIISFDANHFPTDFDDTKYTFVDRENVVVKKGNATPAIQDFALYSALGSDTTMAILQAPKLQLLFFAKDFKGIQPEWWEVFTKIYTIAHKDNTNFVMVSNQPVLVSNFFNTQHRFKVPVLTCDGTVMKTMLRSSVGLIAMQGDKVVQKWSFAHLNEVVAFLHKQPK